MIGRAPGRNRFLLLVTVDMQKAHGDHGEDERSWGNTSEKAGPHAKQPGAARQQKEHCAVVMSCIPEDKPENAIEYLLKEKLSNNSVPDLLL